MRSRQLLRAVFDTRLTHTSQLPPTFLLPCRAHMHQAAQQTQFKQTPADIPPHGSIPPMSMSQSATPPPSPSPASQMKTSPNTISSPPPNRTTSATTPTSKKPLILSKSMQQQLPLLHSQPPHYITTHIHRNPYLVTPGDTLRLPFHMKNVSIGDILRLNRASVLGSREYTLKAGLTGLPPNANPSLRGTGDGSGEQPYLDERLFVCRARVIGVDSGPMMIKEKKKRRQRRTKTVRSKHRYTVLKIMEVKVKSLEEVMQSGEGEQVILE